MTTKIATPPAPAARQLVIVAVVGPGTKNRPAILKAEPICPHPNLCVRDGCNGDCD